MSNDIDSIVRRYGDVMVEQAAAQIAGDSADNIMSGRQLTDPEQIGSGLEPVAPLSPVTITFKRLMNAPFPELARYRTGAMIGSIDSVMNGDGVAMAFVSDDKASEQQSGGGDYPGPPRPFFGISAETMGSIQTIIDRQGAALISELDGVTITLTQTTQV